jgi:predicted permease
MLRSAHGLIVGARPYSGKSTIPEPAVRFILEREATAVLDALLHDVRYSLRSLRRAPGFSVVVIVTLALAVGANTALFSLFNAIVLRMLPVTAPERLAVISLTDERGLQTRFIYGSTFAEFRARQQTFETVSMYSGGGILRAEARGESVEGGVESATPEFYDMLGVRPFLGRFITTADAPEVGESASVVVLGYRFWQRHFGGDPNVLGEIIKVDGVPLEIVGVMRPEFRGLQVDGGADFLLPLAALRRMAGDPSRPIRSLNVIGRLRPGVTLEQARVEVAALWPAVQASTMPAALTPVERDDLRSARTKVDSLATGFSNLRRRYADPLVVLVGLTAVLLVIGCVNLSGLLLVRAVARGQQLQVRVALGASRARLAQQLLLESLLLSVSGTVLALPLAWWVSRVLGATLWGNRLVPLAMSTTPDGRVLSVAAVIAVITGALVGALPAWLATRHRGIAVQPVRSVVTTGPSGKALLVAQVALSLVLMIGAGLFARSLANLRANDSTFPTRRLLFTRLWMNPDDHRPSNDAAYYPELARQLAQIPGVESVGLSMYFPAYFNVRLSPDVIARADVPDRSTDVAAMTEAASPRFFETVGIVRVQGRDFSWDDSARGTPVAIVNTTLARKLFPTGDAIGQRIRIGKDPARQSIEIVGVVSDAPVGNIREPHVPAAFRPLLQEPQRARVPIVNLRASGDPKGLGDALSRIVASLGRHYVRARLVSTLEEQVNQSLRQERLVAGLSSFFAALAVLLASVGVYGLLAYAVARRTREIGVRMALGATRRSVLQMIVREALVLASIGIGLGVACALMAGRFIESLLYGLAPNDPTTLVGAASLFIVVAAVSGLIPAYRASTIDPMSALRQD